MKAATQLDPEVTRRVLSLACHTHTQIVLTPTAWPRMTLNGFLSAGSAESLVMMITGRLSVDPDRLQDTPCNARLYAEQHYRFATTVSAAPRRNDDRSLTLAYPDAVYVVERRRFHRAALAPSSKVTIQWYRAGQVYRHRASLLNISSDGMACRIAPADAPKLEGAAALRAVFKLPGQDRLFDLPATIKNKTPGSDGGALLGLQFITSRETEEALAVLRETLKDSGAIHAVSEVSV